MQLKIDAAMSAYGFFQVAFAGLDTRLSRSVVALLRCKNTGLAFAVVRRMSFSQRLQILRKAVEQARGDSPLDPETEQLTQACNLASGVSKWRNERIHSELRFIENQPVMVDETGRPMQIDVDTCQEKIREAIRAGVNMEASMPHLVVCEMDLRDLMDESEWETP
jgi:hypothetical protein